MKVTKLSYALLSALMLAGAVAPTVTTLASTNDVTVSAKSSVADTTNLETETKTVIIDGEEVSYDVTYWSDLVDGEDFTDESEVKRVSEMFDGIGTDKIDALSDYYVFDDSGKIKIDATDERLKAELGFTDEQISYLNSILDEAFAIDQFGFVGLVIKISKKTRNLGATLGAAFIAGYIGWYAKDLAAVSPVLAGAVAVIDAGITYAAYQAISKGLTSFKIGKNISGLSFSKTITI